jgi:hypothetical protein
MNVIVERIAPIYHLQVAQSVHKPIHAGKVKYKPKVESYISPIEKDRHKNEINKTEL